jgi:class 3 adenylate cyclase
MEQDVGAAERELGFLLIADMEGSTQSKFLLGEEGAFAALREHNRLIMEQCRKAAPTPGVVLNSLGDAVVAKFPARADERSRRQALSSCLAAARAILSSFEALPPVPGPDDVEFPLRTKLTLQFYDAFRYGRDEQLSGQSEELVGPHIDAAFRIAAISWRFQVLVTERFMAELLLHSAARAGDPRPDGTLDLVRTAHVAREQAARQPRPMNAISVSLEIAGEASALPYWITDAREIARLKGIPDNQRVFLISFESPEDLARRGERQRLIIKVLQDHHAVILASVSLEAGENDDYIDFVLDMLGDASEGSRLESELTLCAAAKIYGEFDFFFRVSCIDDESVRRFFEAIHDEKFGVESVEVRSTVADRFFVNPKYDRILEHFQRRRYDLVLTWFERDPESDLFLRFASYMEEWESEQVRPVEILETGEVIHHKPVYCIFICDSLNAYADFFEVSGLNPTACRSHIGQISRPEDAQLRYSLMSGVYVPPRQRPRASR